MLLGLGLGIIYGSMIEWFIHKYIFHKMGRKKGSMFAYHLKGHHALSRKNNFVDLTESKVETYGMIGLVIIHMPFMFLSPGFWIGITSYALSFKYLHGFQHSHPEFTKKYMKWHWDHHMKDSNKNFGVVLPLSDYLFSTRKKYKD
jgi:sterol desaturase/sphingolipid hydroxylase (fatty acid hydroxylase superfamily)